VIPIVPEKRRDGRSSFVKLITYVSQRDEDKPDMPISPDNPYVRPSRSSAKIFDQLLSYVDRHASPDDQMLLSYEGGVQQVMSGDVVCETNCFGLDTAAAEMNAVALQNTRCIDPVYHAILSWREEDRPTEAQIFDSARYCLKQLGMSENQYVFAIHRDTDNVHCHITANRVHPVSYRAANLYNDVNRLHKACRHLELKHGFTPDNGAWVINENSQVVRAKSDFKSIPRKARQLEYYADKESLFSYAVSECRSKIDEAMHNPQMTWRDVHQVLARAGLELKRKGEGLAVYSIDNPTCPPVKASSVHPDLTRSCLEKDLGEFVPMRNAGRYTLDETDNAPDAIVHEFRYEPNLHARDAQARLERRLARADAREDLRARYEAYKLGWVRPEIDPDAVKQRYQSLSKTFSWQKARIRISVDDPLLRKLMYNIVEVEKMKAMSVLRQTIKEERAAFRADPDNRRLSYRAWVEQQAISHDQAAIAQLRGWAYRLKRHAKTSSISSDAIVCAVADDTPAFKLDGYMTSVTRDGTVQYSRHGEVKVQDRGSRIEIAYGCSDSTDNIAAGMALAEHKSGEQLRFEGEPAFVSQSCSMVTWFNEGGDKPLPLTDPLQRVLSGYAPQTTTAEAYKELFGSAPAAAPREEPASKTQQTNKPNNTYRPQ